MFGTIESFSAEVQQSSANLMNLPYGICILAAGGFGFWRPVKAESHIVELKACETKSLFIMEYQNERVRV